MLVAVFSDVHGNINALNKVMNQIKERKADLVIFLGDIFQRGNNEIECLEILKSSDIICLKGNCELYLEHGVDIDPAVEYLREYYGGIRAKLTDEQMKFVQEMPLFYQIEVEGHKLHFSHFLFSDIDAAYPFFPLSDLNNGNFDKACESDEIKQYELVAIGHSHKNFIKGKVVSVSATGLEGASYLLIEITEAGLNFEHIDIPNDF